MFLIFPNLSTSGCQKRHSLPGLRVICSLCGLICVTSCVAPAALLLRGRSSITCSLLIGDSREDVAQPAATRLLFRSHREDLANPWPKSWQKRHVHFIQRSSQLFRDILCVKNVSYRCLFREFPSGIKLCWEIRACWIDLKDLWWGSSTLCSCQTNFLE